MPAAALACAAAAAEVAAALAAAAAAAPLADFSDGAVLLVPAAVVGAADA